jgi:hypothetical protein
MGGEVPPMLRRPPRQHRLTDSKNRRGNRERGRTRDAADASGIELQHELGHRLPGHTAVPARLKLRRRHTPTFGRTNEPAGTPGDGNLEVTRRRRTARWRTRSGTRAGHADGGVGRGARGGDVRLHRHQGDADAQGARHSEFEHCTNDRHKAEFESV